VRLGAAVQMAESALENQTAETPPMSEANTGPADDQAQQGRASGERPGTGGKGGRRGGSGAGSPELSLSYEGSEMDDANQDGADSQPTPSTQRLKSKIVSQSSIEDRRSEPEDKRRVNPQQANGSGGSRPSSRQDLGEGRGRFSPSVPPQQLQQLRHIQAQQQHLAARAAAQPGMGVMRRGQGPWMAPENMVRPMQRGPHQPQPHMGPHQPQPQPPRPHQHQQGQPWGPKAVPIFPDITAGTLEGARPLSKEEFMQMQMMGVPILPFAGGTGSAQQRGGSQPLPPPPGPHHGALRDAAPLGMGGPPATSNPAPVSTLSTDERLKMAEERRRMQAEVNRLTKEKAVLEARERARSAAEAAGRGRGRGRGGRGGRGRNTFVLARDGPAAEGQVEAPEQQAEAAEPAAPSPAGADTPKASTEMSAKEAAAQALAREMAQLRAKIAAAEKRKKAARLQADPVQDAGATSQSAAERPATGVQDGQQSGPSEPMQAQSGGGDDSAREPFAARNTSAAVGSEDWDDGGWPPPEEVDGEVLVPGVAPSQPSPQTEAAPSAEIPSEGGEGSRRRHHSKRRHGDEKEKKSKRDRSDRESHQERRERKRRERSSRHASGTPDAPSAGEPTGANGEQVASAEMDLRDRLEEARRQKRSRFAAEALQ